MKMVPNLIQRSAAYLRYEPVNSKNSPRPCSLVLTNDNFCAESNPYPNKNKLIQKPKVMENRLENI